MEFQHAAKVLEGKLVVATLDIHGELVDRTIHEGLRGWKGDVYAVGGHRGGIEGAEGTVAHLTAHVVNKLTNVFLIFFWNCLVVTLRGLLI